MGSEQPLGQLTDLAVIANLLPEAASSLASQVDLLFFVLMGLCLFMVVLIVGLIVLYSWRYRESSEVRRPDPHMPEWRELLIELGWTTPVVAIFLGLFLWGAVLYIEQYGEPEAATTVNVIGKQWMWKAQHPNGAREINELHVPTGERIRIRLTSEDVIHSFSIPALRLKRDALPQSYTTFSFEASEPGVYNMYCTEYCGTDHAKMRGRVVAMEPGDFGQWLDGQQVSETPAARGKRLFTAYGCAGCHEGDSSVRAPNLAGIFGRPVQLADGSSVVADHAYIRDSILLPQKHVTAGYEPIMPSFEGQIEAEEILQIVAYIQSLDTQQKEGRP